MYLNMYMSRNGQILGTPSSERGLNYFIFTKFDKIWQNVNFTILVISKIEGREGLPLKHVFYIMCFEDQN